MHECDELREMKAQMLETQRSIDARKTALLKETTAEKDRGRAWDTKLRQSAFEVRDLRKTLEEEEGLYHESVSALERQKLSKSELSGLKQLKDAMTFASYSLRGSGNQLLARRSLHSSSSTSSREEILVEELHAAENLHMEARKQVVEAWLQMTISHFFSFA